MPLCEATALALLCASLLVISSVCVMMCVRVCACVRVSVQGEVMLYHVAWCLLRHAASCGVGLHEKLFTFVFRPNDVDALTGAVAFVVGLVLILRSTYAGASVATLGPRLLLQMHPK